VPVLGEGEGDVEFNPADPVDSEGSMEGMGELSVLMVTKCFCKRDARRVRLDSARASPLLPRAPVMQHSLTLTVIPVYALKRESFWSWTVVLGGEPVARLRSSANPRQE
jgi:hypothetical protein